MSEAPTLAPLQGKPAKPGVKNRFVAGERYTSPLFSDLERERLWTRVWQIACREEDLPEPGDVFLYSIGDQEIMVVRQPDGALKGLYNSCRHRGMPLVDASSCGKTQFTCPYHGWTYNLDGSLQYALSPDEFPCYRDYGLRQVCTDTWGGFIFVNLDPNAPPLADYLDPIPAELEAYHLDQMVCTLNRTLEVPVNWKAAMEAFGESYHVAGTHPQLLSSTDDVNTTYDSQGLHSRMVVPLFTPSPRIGPVDPKELFELMMETFAQVGMSMGGDAGSASADDGGSPPEVAFPEEMTLEGLKMMVVQGSRQAADGIGWDVSGLSDERFCEAHSWWAFPNVLLQTTPIQMFVWHCRPNGRDPQSCLLSQYVLSAMPPGAPKTPAPREFFTDWRESGGGLILEQDWRNLFRWQRGIRQRTFDGPVFAETQESGCTHFHEMVDQFISEGVRPSGS